MIEKLSHKYDPRKILESIPLDILNSPELEKENQLSITVENANDSLFSSIGSLYDYEERKVTDSTNKYTTVHSIFKNTYIAEVIDDVKKVAAEYGVMIGRVRLLLLPPLKCYSYHRDLDEFRFHIPLKTNPYAKFIVGDKIGTMPELGSLYKFATRDYHSAFNSSNNQTRIHLVFDTFQ